MRPAAFLLLSGVLSAPAAAGTVTVTIPRLSVAEYHRPYVAIWLEPARGGPARTLALWYDVDKGGKEPGTKWLGELRTWWRKGGRSMKMPANGISGATRTPGEHVVPLPAHLPAGSYILNVEAAREAGGREIVSVPLVMPIAATAASGKSELGAIVVGAR